MSRQNLKLLIIWASIFVFITVNACSKSGNDSPADMRTLHVLEFKTNTPIANADVYLKQCTHPDPYGCLADSVIGKLTTDNDGSFQYNLLLALELNKDPASLFSFGIRQSYDLPADTTVLLESFGNNNNSIIWYFTDHAGTVVTTETGGSLPDYYINRFDTATAEVDY